MLKYVIVVICGVSLLGCGGSYTRPESACDEYVVTWLDAAELYEIDNMLLYKVNKIVEPFDFVLSSNVANHQKEIECVSAYYPDQPFYISDYKPEKR